MATKEQLLKALRKADAAGDVAAAKAIARRLAQMRGPTMDAQAAPSPQANGFALPSEIPDYRTLGSEPLPQERQQYGFGDKLMAAGETGLSLLSGATTGALGYGAGAIEGLADQVMNMDFSPEAGARTEQLASQKAAQGTFEPRGELGQEYLKNTAETIEQVAGGLPPIISGGSNFLAQPVKTNRPRLSNKKGLAVVDPDKLLELPAEVASRLLKDGIDPANLSPEMFGKIMRWHESPNSSPNTMGALIKQARKDNLKRKTGDTGLAPYKLDGDQVKPDKDAIDAMDNGYDKGTVQLAKTADPATKKGMLESLKTHISILNNSRNLTNARTTDVAGNSLAKRVFHIRDKNQENRKKLDKVTQTKKFRETEFDDSVIRSTINEIFDDLDIIDERGPNDPIPRPNFKGSIIDGDKGSQKAITEMIRILGNARGTKSLNAHLMKRQLDSLIDFRKKTQKPMGREGRNALKNLRATINEELRAKFPDYAKVNDDLSAGLTALDGLMDVMPSKLKDRGLYERGVESMLGQELRVLFGNRQTRVPLEDALYRIDDTAVSLGGKFDDSYKDLYLFSKGIEDALGNTLRSSFGSEIETAVGTALTQSPETAFLQLMAGDITGKMAKRKARKQHAEAYRSMRTLLERKE